jgi:hypothetical protein
MAGIGADGVIVKIPGTNYSTYGKDSFTKAGALSVGNVIAEGLVHDPIFGRLLNWLILACIFMTFLVFWPVWAIIWIYCYFAHRKGTVEIFNLLKDMAFGKP